MREDDSKRRAFSVNYELLARCNNPQWVGAEAKKMYFLSWLMQHPTDPAAKEVYQHKGGRILDGGEYSQKCAELWRKCIKQKSSSGEEFYDFVSSMVVCVVGDYIRCEKQRVETEIVAQRNKLEELESRLRNIENV